MRGLTAALLLSFAIAGRTGAQDVGSRVNPEFRGDIIAARNHSDFQVGVGAQVPAGYYVRIGITAAAGYDAAHNGAGASSASARGDIIARFLLDPFRQTRWGVSAGGGVAVFGRMHERSTPLLVAVLDLEGPRSRNGWGTAIQVGVGGGVRVGAALRGAALRTR